MYVTDKADIVIDASPEVVWECVTDPVHWTASNPEEHYGLEYDTPDNRPREGATFHQAEEVAGMFASETPSSEPTASEIVCEQFAQLIPRMLMWLFRRLIR